PEQAMYHFISGYTAKIPGTVRGITEPEATFSACFGAPFMPMHPTVYAELLAEKTKEHNSNIWLFNTGWTGGPYGEGHRMELKYTRQMVSEALAGNLNDVEYKNDEIFGLAMPVKVNGIPNEVLDPRNTWEDKQAYDKKARQLARMFKENFQQFKGKASDELIEAGPVV
ncbi:MAG TPA: phosphoenolpyruvate carboxykinase (ATP), partial [Balneolaceae bacterium]|nr:phosphoenolpyruvate carboxykinase (ATP) [Balneolaceae bacterium]